MNYFLKWVHDCQKHNVDIYTLESDGNVRLLQTRREYWESHTKFHSTPIFHVWDRDEWVMATEDYQAAFKKYMEIHQRG